MSFTSRVKIEDLINNGSILVHKDGNHGAKYPRTEEFGEVGVPFLTAKLLDSSGNIHLLNAPRLATEKAKKFTFGFVQTEDVLLSHNATVGRVAVMPQVAEPILIGTSLTHFRLDKSKILPTYLAAYFSGKDFQDQLAAVMSQTTRNQVPITSQRKLYIELPSIDIQTEIVKHIDSIDNKIRLNNQINQTLESIAQAIFKSWFIDFEPVRAKIAAKQEGKDPERAAMCAISGKTQAELEQMAMEDFAELQATAALFPDELVESELGEVPRGWEVSTIGKRFNVVMGQSPKGDTYNGNKHGKLFFQGRAEFGWRYPTPRLYTTDPKRVAKENDILMSVRAPVGDMNVAMEECCIGRGLSALSHRSGSFSYSYYCLKALQSKFNVFNGEGTVFGSINQNDLKNISFIEPINELIDLFAKTINKYDQRIKLNSFNTKSLIDVRDTLLPKLLSGELDVSDLQGEGA